MFFTRLIESNDLTRVDQSKGRFRAFLLAACKNFLANERDRREARKRGGGRVIFAIDSSSAERSYDGEPAHWLTALGRHPPAGSDASPLRGNAP
jgi:hypothetical protein